MSSRQLDEERIFHTAREIPNATVRSDYLDQVCAGDQALRERVEALLAVHEQEQSFLKSNGQRLAATVDHGAQIEKPGVTIGHYKLMEQIGEGGMGTVFIAQQDRPIRRKVALKVIKPGMDSRAVVARFEAERQALAMMDHPNIAKVLDAGTTDSGRPYFAMELVKGVPITEYCDRNRLTIRERLELFIQVCQAIQHAHQKGIIHRDIKPSNVLVTLHDGKPVPKVIDFGVAKALNARLTDKTIYTEHLQVVGTLLYMSPEQAELSGLDVDTRSDIYSLGVLLYELLTGTTPFQKDELDKAGLDEQRRMIRDKEPPKASVRISSLGETATTVAEHRKTDPKKLNQVVRGDLDWIVMMALDKDRTRRYDTAQSLGEDLRRYSRNDPVLARAPTTSYCVQKFFQRHWRPFVVAMAFVLAMAGGTIASLSLAARAIRAEALARRQKDQLEDLILKTTFSEVVGRDKGRGNDAIRRAKAAGVDPTWIKVFEGYLAIGEPNADETIASLESLDPQSVACLSVLAALYSIKGDLEGIESTSKRLDGAKPRSSLEKLLFGQAIAPFDPNRGIREIQLALQADAVPGGALVLADAHLWKAYHFGDVADLELVLKHVQAASIHGAGTPLGMGCELLAQLKLYQHYKTREPEKAASHLSAGRQLAERIRRLDAFQLNTVFTGLFCDEIDDPQASSDIADALQRRVLRANGSSMAAAYWLRCGDAQKARRAVATDQDRDRIFASLISALVGDVDGARRQFGGLYTRLSPEQKAMALAISAIVEGPRDAEKRALLLKNEPRLSDLSRETVELFANVDEQADLASQFELSRFYFRSAVWHQVNGRLNKARDLFEECREGGLRPHPEYFWARYFLAQENRTDTP